LSLRGLLYDLAAQKDNIIFVFVFLFGKNKLKSNLLEDKINGLF